MPFSSFFLAAFYATGIVPPLKRVFFNRLLRTVEIGLRYY